MRKTLVINAVGLTPSLIGDATPAIRALIERGRLATVREVTPAVTCSAQATYLTGVLPQKHGIVGNGWYHRDTCEVRFWHQSAKLIQSPTLFDTLRTIDPSATVANINWWFAMYSSADYTVTPRPMYPADGRKLPDIWTHPPSLRDELQSTLGRFPLFKYWGPLTSIDATRWLASAAIEVDRRFAPTLALLYLPHLDYNLQRVGPTAPNIAEDLRELDDEIARLASHFANARIVLLSEYGIDAATRPIHLNRVLRDAGLLAIREEVGRELLDAGASAAFAVADHQVAHVYVNDRSRIEEATRLVAGEPGVSRIYVGAQRKEIGLDHPRAGDIVAVAERDAWFTYYYWLDDARAPDFARTVDIHRKPGYDPCELFFDPKLAAPKLRVARKLLSRKLGFRNLLDVTPLDTTLVKGSHGVPAATRDGRPVFIGDAAIVDREEYDAVDVRDLILRHLTTP